MRGDKIPGLPGPYDAEGGGLPVGPGLQPELAIGGREVELRRALVDPVEPLPHRPHPAPWRRLLLNLLSVQLVFLFAL